MGDDKQGKVNILCMKWGDKYQAKYVNTLYQMVEKNLSKPFRFICLTDDDNGLITNIESFPIPEIRASLSGPERGWNKLSVFSSTLYDLEGDVLCLDLDLIIVGKLDDLFDYPGDFLIIKDWIKHDGTGNSSVYRFCLGAHPEVLAEFEKSSVSIKKSFRNEQEYLSSMMLSKKCLQYWPSEWCKSFKRHCIKPLSFFVPRETAIPDNSRIIVFHGKPDPDDAIRGNSGKWYRRFKPATWIKNYWS